MRITKLDMARVIVTALYKMKTLAPADHPEVVKRTRKGSIESLTWQHKLALSAIESTREIA